jgi:hypothetical protein
MQKKVFFGMAAVFLAVMMAACPTTSDGGGGVDDGNDDQGEVTGWEAKETVNPGSPELPTGFKIQSGFELIDAVNLKTVTDAAANDPANQSAVVALSWKGEGAQSYNLYWENEIVESKPTAKATNVTDTVYFARNLEADTTYYFWVEAVNPSGNRVSKPVSVTTGKKGPQASGGVERGDYPRNMKVDQRNGSLSVSWDLSDRVGWYEVYYAPKSGSGSISHLDIFTPVVFKWSNTTTSEISTAIDISAAVTTAGGASKVAYKDGYSSSSNGTGYTRPIYPYSTPLAPNSGWEGYYVRDGDNGVDGDGRPILGTNAIANGVFHRIMEASLDDLKDPYKPLDAAFANAIPWDGTSAGAAGTPVKFFGTSTTITGLTNNTEYEVWVRSPNANGERGYSYVVGKPGSNTLAAVAGINVTTPANTSRNLNVTWTAVSSGDPTGYRIYASKFSYQPNPTMDYTLVASNVATCELVGLQSDTDYYIWVVAEKDGVAGAFGSSVSHKTGSAPESGHVGDKTIVGTNQKVKTAVYIEVNDDNPLNAGSYILDDGTYLFDYVVLFAANIRNRTPCDDGCKESGVHVHLNPNVRHILNNRNKYIQPLQDKGIKVLLGLLGDHDGISFGTMTDAQRATFMANLRSKVDSYGLDGVDFDDEWGSKEDWNNWSNSYKTISPNSIWTYPTSSWSWPTTVTVYRDPAKGIVPGNGTLVAPSEPDMNRMWKESGDSYYKTIKAARDTLGSNKIISLYEYNTGRYITENGAANTTATKALLEGAVDFALQPWYNRYIDDSGNGIARAKYSPFGMDLSGEAYPGQNGAPNPPISISDNVSASGTIKDYATRFKTAGNYGMLYFYALEEASALLKQQSNTATARVTKEEYISMMTDIVFGKKTLLTKEGGDYRKDW